VQLYVRDPVAIVARPVLELRGFKRIELGAGQRKRVTFSLTPSSSHSGAARPVADRGRPHRFLDRRVVGGPARQGSFEITKTQRARPGRGDCRRGSSSQVTS
jgi:hypothetical protein